MFRFIWDWLCSDLPEGDDMKVETIIVTKNDVENGYVKYTDAQGKEHKIPIKACLGDVIRVPKPIE